MMTHHHHQRREPRTSHKVSVAQSSSGCATTPSCSFRRFLQNVGSVLCNRKVYVHNTPISYIRGVQRKE